MILNQDNKNKWFKNVVVFFIPVLLMYLIQVQGSISQPFHVITHIDFVPSAFTYGGMSLYIVNSLIDFLKKYKDSQSQ